MYRVGTPLTALPVASPQLVRRSARCEPVIIYKSAAFCQKLGGLWLRLNGKKIAEFSSFCRSQVARDVEQPWIHLSYCKGSPCVKELEEPCGFSIPVVGARPFITDRVVVNRSGPTCRLSQPVQGAGMSAYRAFCIDRSVWKGCLVHSLAFWKIRKFLSCHSASRANLLQLWIRVSRLCIQLTAIPC